MPDDVAQKVIGRGGEFTSLNWSARRTASSIVSASPVAPGSVNSQMPTCIPVLRARAALIFLLCQRRF